MKIFTTPGTANSVGANKVNEKDAGEFDSKMSEKKSATDIKNKLKGLLERIDVQATRLSKRLSIEDLREYKKLIKEFLDVAVSNSYSFTKERLLDHRGRHRIFGLVKKVNEELESLTGELLKSEKNRIGILSKMDDIRGLLVDVAA